MNTVAKEKGFTIIEVVLVLAIAGLIFLMVFIALPALQRGQRDTQRESDLSRMNAQLTNYQSNNKNGIPSGTGTGATTWSTFMTRYMRPSGEEFKDPDGTDYTISVTNNTAPTVPAFSTAPGAARVIYIVTQAKCNGEDVTIGQGTRKVAFLMPLEGGGVACVNN